MRYFYKKKTGEFMGCTTENIQCPKKCAETTAKPDHNGQLFDKDSGAWVDPVADESEE